MTEIERIVKVLVKKSSVNSEHIKIFCDEYSEDNYQVQELTKYDVDTFELSRELNDKAFAYIKQISEVKCIGTESMDEATKKVDFLVLKANKCQTHSHICNAENTIIKDATIKILQKLAHSNGHIPLDNFLDLMVAKNILSNKLTKLQEKQNELHKKQVELKKKIELQR